MKCWLNFKFNKRRLFAISINQLNFTSVGTDEKKKKNDVPVDNSFLIWLPVHFFFCARFPPPTFLRGCRHSWRHYHSKNGRNGARERKSRIRFRSRCHHLHDGPPENLLDIFCSSGDHVENLRRGGRLAVNHHIFPGHSHRLEKRDTIEIHMRVDSHNKTRRWIPLVLTLPTMQFQWPHCSCNNRPRRCGDGRGCVRKSTCSRYHAF